jgi:hypothetical protein
MPGTPLGAFTVTGTLTSNTCGTGVGAPNPWTFQVSLSVDGSTLYWNSGSPPYLSGILNSSNEASFGQTETGTDAADASGCATNPNQGDLLDPGQSPVTCPANSGCSMTRSDEYAVTLATNRKSFTGTVSYTFAIASGTCSSDYSSAGGPYDVLPCSFAYSLSASR